jgi:anti-sigma-K factor RskA
VGDSQLRAALVAVGVPRSAPTGGGGFDWAKWTWIGAAGAALVLALAFALTRSRRLRPEPAV